MERAGHGAAATAEVQEAPSGTGAMLLAQLRTLGPGRILALGVVALAMLGFFAYVILRAVEKPYTLLFSGLELADSRQLVDRLEAMGVPYRLASDGGAVMVPADQALKLRMSLAEEGLPTGGTVGDELFDKASGLTTTDFLSDVSLRRALEGELARSIAHLRPVRSARVHLVQPKRELFRRDSARASASIVLSLARGAELDKRQIAGIRHLVAGAVPGLDVAAISIVDDRGTLLARPLAEGEVGAGLDDAEDYRIAYEDRIRQKLIQLLERSLGAGRVEVEVAADFNFDEVATTAETYDPEGQVVRSTQTVEESNDRSDVEPQDQVSVANNLPTEADSSGPAGKSDERGRRTEETTNFEISRIVRNEKRRGGVLRRLSIAVQVDGTTRTEADGSQTFAPRPAEELGQIEALVRSAAGIDDERGDVVQVVSRQLVTADVGEPEAEPFLGIDVEHVWRLIELGTLVGVALLMLLFGVRPAIRRLLPEPVVEIRPELPLVTEAGGEMLPGAAAVLPAGEAAQAVVGRPAGHAALPAAEAGTQLDNVVGHVRVNLIEEVAQIVHDYPNDAVRVVRNWLHGS